MSHTPSSTGRFLRVLLIIVVMCVIALYLGWPVAVGVFATVPNRKAVGDAPTGFEELTLTTVDGVLLNGWYRPPGNGAVIVLLHGAGSSRESVRPYAAFLARHDFGVLAMDLRGHGQSGGKTNKLGWQGTEDVAAAVSFLTTQDDVKAIGGLGLSLGGEVLLGAAADYPQLRAIIADGATRRCTAELLALESERPLVRNFTARVMYATVGLLTGDAPPTPLLDSMLASASTRFLFIAAERDPLEVAFNELFVRMLGSRASLWLVPDADHTGGHDRHPKAYEQTVIDFFQNALIGIAPASTR